jgi:hypothetical protein
MWRFASASDCAGNDSAGSQGAKPTAERCDQTTQGTVAICWDGAKYKHHDFADAACTYKTVAVGACQGGPNTGAMYECVSATAAAPVVDAPPVVGGPMPKGWVEVGVGNCGAKDVSSSGGGKPVPWRCEAKNAGKIAVCWEKVRQPNGKYPNGACVYKAVTPDECKDTVTPGIVYLCNP